MSSPLRQPGPDSVCPTGRRERRRCSRQLRGARRQLTSRALRGAAVDYHGALPYSRLPSEVREGEGVHILGVHHLGWITTRSGLIPAASPPVRRPRQPPLELIREGVMELLRQPFVSGQPRVAVGAGCNHRHRWAGPPAPAQPGRPPDLPGRTALRATSTTELCAQACYESASSPTDVDRTTSTNLP